MTEQLPFDTTQLASVASAAPRRAPSPTTGRPPRLWWRLDDDTKRIGREGVARAREALQEARKRAVDTPDREFEHPTAA